MYSYVEKVSKVDNINFGTFLYQRFLRRYIMGLTIKWDSTYMCNLNCKHCINGDYLGDISIELNYEEFENIIKDIKSK